MTDITSWALLGASALIFCVYEGYVWYLGRTRPESTARYAHARMRVAWVHALDQRPGFEIVAVQALRNSLMSATIVASTAALALMGSVTLAGSAVRDSLAHFETGPVTARPVLEGLLVVTLFVSYVFSSNSMRFFNHACFVMAMPADSRERADWMPLAADYVERAGLFYSWGLRTFLMVAPLVAGIVEPVTMPAMTLLLIGVQAHFDRPARPRPRTMRTRSTDSSVSDLS